MKKQHKSRSRPSKHDHKSIQNRYQIKIRLFDRLFFDVASKIAHFDFQSVQEPPKINPEVPPKLPRHHPGTKSLPKTSQEPPQTSRRSSQEQFRITCSSNNEPPNHNFRDRNFQFPRSICRSLLSEAGGTGLAPLNKDTCSVP